MPAVGTNVHTLLFLRSSALRPWAARTLASSHPKMAPERAMLNSEAGHRNTTALEGETGGVDRRHAAQAYDARGGVHIAEHLQLVCIQGRTAKAPRHGTVRIDPAHEAAPLQRQEECICVVGGEQRVHQLHPAGKQRIDATHHIVAVDVPAVLRHDPRDACGWNATAQQ
eukprot:scaffold21186_cov67-Phaeocystis_antarctica.AAC.2